MNTTKIIQEKDLMLDIDTIDAVGREDLAILCSYATERKEILETGTRCGRTAMNLAKFCPPDGRVVSVDIDQSNARKTWAVMPEHIQKKVTLIEHDTNTLDFTALGKFDMVFIDGDHSADGVISDTLNAVKILKPGGVIFWHDFMSLPIAVGLYTIQISKIQIGRIMGISYGSFNKNVTTRVRNDHLRIVRDWITEHLKLQGEVLKP